MYASFVILVLKKENSINLNKFRTIYLVESMYKVSLLMRNIRMGWVSRCKTDFNY